MRNTVSAIVAFSLVALVPVAAQANASRQENIGVGAGAIIGAAAGGPVGLIVGAAIGAKLGDDMHRQEREIEALSTSLEQSRNRVADLEHDIEELDTDIGTLNAELEKMRRVARPELVDLLQAGIETDLLFRSNESELADTTGIRLNELASTLASMPGIRVRLDGFADERGDESYNLQLSERRVQSVRDQLIAAGVDASRISATAHGESPAQDASIDSLALERRVSLTLFIDDSPSVAANPQ